MPVDTNRSPFSRVFDPDQSGTLTGLMGRAMGNNTALERQGSVRGGAQAALSDAVSKGKTPQQAILEYLKTPEGQQAFVSDPDFDKSLKSWADNITPPSPTMTNVAPGAMAVQTGQDGKVMNTFRNPTAEVQTFNEMAAIAKLPAERLRQLAEIQLLPGPEKQTAKEKAVSELVRSYGLPQEIGTKLLADVYRTVSIKDAFGAVVGEGVMDITSGQMIQPGQATSPNFGTAGPGFTGPAQGAPQGVQWPAAGTTQVPGQAPQQPQAQPGRTGQMPQTAPTPGLQPGNVDIQDMYDDKRTMFFGAGLAPTALSWANSVFRQIDPGLQVPGGQKSTGRRQAIQELHVALDGLTREGAGLGIPTVFINDLKALAPGFGPFESPSDALSKGMKLLQRVTDEITAQEANIRDPNVPAKVKVEAASRAKAYQTIERALPTMEEMQELKRQLDSGTAPVMTPGTAVRSLEETTRKGVKAGVEDLSSGGKKPAQAAPRPGQTPQAGAEPELKGNPYAAMSAKELLKVDPKSVKEPALRAALRARLDELLMKKGK